jgi:hypothetical protein
MAYGPSKYKDYAVWLANCVAGIERHKTDCAFPTKACTEVKTKADAFLAAHAKAVDPNAGNVDRQVRKTAKKNIDSAISDFAKRYIYLNDKVTDPILEELGFPIHDNTHTKHPAPAQRPVVLAEHHGKFGFKVTVLDPDTMKKTKPKYAHGARYMWQLGGVKPANARGLPNSHFNMGTIRIFEFAEDDKGKPFFIAACYENTTGEPGPDSEIVESLVD